MKTLKEHWDLRNQMHQMNRNKESLTDIKCPDCGEALYADFTMILTSDPPCYNAWCKKCKWRGHI